MKPYIKEIHHEDGSVEWIPTDEPQPPRPPVPIARVVELTYGQKREREYPRITEQLDMLWHAMNDNEALRTEPFYSTIKAIKDKYPKEQ